MRKVHWNILARSDYYKNIDYLLREWSEKDAQKFIDEVDDVEFILKQKYRKKLAHLRLLLTQ